MLVLVRLRLATLCQIIFDGWLLGVTTKKHVYEDVLRNVLTHFHSILGNKMRSQVIHHVSPPMRSHTHKQNQEKLGLNIHAFSHILPQN